MVGILVTSNPVCGGCPRAFDAVFELDMDCAFESDELAEVCNSTVSWQDPDGHPCAVVAVCGEVV